VPDPGQVDAESALVRLVRDEGRIVLATLVRNLGAFDLAEDAVQEAVVRALETWPARGVPASPRAWLTTTARNWAIDRIRREGARGPKEEEAVRMGSAGDALPPESVVRDDQLRLVFTCCHPALSIDAQVALSLRTLCGLTTGEVARALLVGEATMTKRLTRARQKIALAGIPYRVPADHELPARLTAVVTTVYLVFNEGYAATAGADLVRHELADEALRLARLLHELLPDEPAVTGLLALILLQHARRSARLDAVGEVVLLADQDRSSWDRAMIAEGVTLVGEGLRRTPHRADPFVVQAAIAACHALAPSYETTEWDAIVSWYDTLLTVQDTPVVRLNRAVAIGERDGPVAALALIDELQGLGSYAPYHASRAELLARAGRPEEAASARAAALALPLSDAQQRFLRRDDGPEDGSLAPT
jgi:RNA polymerase sigma-70 factor (ECF subfamily)